MSLISLPPDLQAKIDARIESGAAADAIDVVRAGLEALERSDVEKLEAVRAKIKRAIEDPRPSAPADEVFDRIEAAIISLAGR